MAGKGLILTSRRLGYALDKLSKSALIDLVVDRARAEIGEEANEEDIAERIQDWIGPVLRARNDRLVGLIATMANLDKNDEDYRNKAGKYALVPPKPESTIPPEAMQQALDEQRNEPVSW